MAREVGTEKDKGESLTESEPQSQTITKLDQAQIKTYMVFDLQLLTRRIPDQRRRTWHYEFQTFQPPTDVLALVTLPR